MISTRRFPDIYIFLFVAVVIASLDLLLAPITGKYLFYDYITQYGLIGVLVTSVIVYVIGIVFYTLIEPDNGETREIINSSITDYLESQNIALRDNEKIISVVTRPPLTKSYVLTNKRLFYFEINSIVKNVWFDDVKRFNYKEKFGTTLSFYSKDKSRTVFAIGLGMGSTTHLLAELKTILQDRYVGQK